VQKSSEFTKFEDELSKILNTDVKLVSNSKGRGNLQISFKNEKEFAAILELLRSLNNK
jgi:ParB family chromosome partitioning protein